MNTVPVKSQVRRDIDTLTDLLNRLTSVALAKLTETLVVSEYIHLSDELVTMRDGLQALLSTCVTELTGTERSLVPDTLTNATTVIIQLASRIDLLNSTSWGGYQPPRGVTKQSSLN